MWTDCITVVELDKQTAQCRYQFGGQNSGVDRFISLVVTTHPDSGTRGITAVSEAK